MIESVKTQGFRGRDLDVRLSRFTLIQGPVGAGKTAVLDAIRYGAAFPDPRLGEQNLDQLSPTGNWWIELGIDGKRFTRSLRGGKGGFAIDGKAVGAKDYEAALRRVLCLDAHHLDARAFVSLSGEKRAAMFSELLGDHVVALADCFKLAGAEGGADSMESLAITMLGAQDARRMGNLFAASPRSGTPQSLVADLTTAKAAAKQRQGDAEKAMQAAESAKAQAGADPAQLRRDIEALDQKIGGHRAELANIESATRAYDAAKAMVDGMQARINNFHRLAGGARALFATGAAIEAKIAEASRREAASGEPLCHRTLQAAITSVEGLSPPDDATSADMRAGWNRGLNAAIEAIDALVAADKKRAALPSAAALKRELDGLRADLDKALRALPEAERYAASALSEEQELVKAQEQLQKMAAPADAGTINQLLSADRLRRQELATEATNAERRLATASSGPAAAADVTKYHAAIRVIEAGIALVQRYRDITLASAIEKVTAPMEARLASLFGRPVPVQFTMQGQGRGAQVDFRFTLAESPVRLVDLSDGEFVMVSIAFLSTLQSIKETPGSLLLAEIDPLTPECAEPLMRGLPSMGLEQVLIATNRGVSVPALEGWSGVLLVPGNARPVDKVEEVAPAGAGLFAPA